MDVLAIGGGLGGLAAAHGLIDAGATVTVAERRPADRREGSGLSLFGNGLDALASVGLLEHVERLTGGVPPTGGGVRRPAGAWLARPPAASYARLRVVHRAELRDARVAALPDGTVRHDTTAGVLDAASGLADVGGEQRTFDLVVGADGLNSRTRLALDLPGAPLWARYGCWRGVTPEPVKAVVPGETWGRGKRFGVVPLPDGRVYWFAVRGGLRGERPGDQRARVLEEFRGWHDPIARVVEATPAEGVFWRPIDELAPDLPTFVAGRVALLGDAAHAMTPNLGQGANQAFEDAATLAALVAGGAGVEEALVRYDAVRRPRAQKIAAQARALGRLAQAGGVAGALRDRLVAAAPASAMARGIESVQRWEP